MFIVLLFPMTIALFASVSQDASIISCAFLLVAIIDNTEFGNKTYSKWQVYAMIILMSILLNVANCMNRAVVGQCSRG